MQETTNPAGTIVLHLGAHKTGTTLIQDYMRLNTPLLMRNGVSFVPRRRTFDLFGFGDAAKVTAGVETLRQDVANAWDAGCRHFIISHEDMLGRPVMAGRDGLYPRKHQALGALAREYGEDEVVIVFYLRHQDEFIESYYLQRINEGAAMSFDEWLGGIDTTKLSWRTVLDSIRDAFPKAKIEVRMFADEISGGQSRFIERFFSCFGTFDREAFEDFAFDNSVNISLGDKGLEMALHINRVVTTKKERELVRRFLQTHFSNRDYPRPVLLGPEQREALRNIYAAENARLVNTPPVKEAS
ncbi:hypothetical protein LXM94_13200 [Rhizobium sp. TRM95111]|uniref:hypothetical protein n=1 Tax=Rhizobium alarense TaxID=2846851 RepID=UPI001F2D879A|nr:hypothetical protein [Rhizobium alarense]MCF3640928.1 hypothetical protein [Rhizobium alarense]